MISVSVTRRGPIHRLAQGLSDEGDRAAFESARYFPTSVRNNILNRVKPSGGSQHPNTNQRWIERKGHSHPLIGLTSTLSNPLAWPKPRRIKRGEYAADPPDRDVINGLQAKGYEVIGASEEFLRFLRARFKEQLQAAIRRWGG